MPSTIRNPEAVVLAPDGSRSSTGLREQQDEVDVRWRQRHRPAEPAEIQRQLVQQLLPSTDAALARSPYR